MASDTSAAPAASWRRFWITILCFALANAGVWAVYFKFYRPRRDVLRVDQFLPGENETVAGRPTLTWKFNLDVMPAGTKNVDAKVNRRTASTAPAETAPGIIHPNIAGKWTWLDSRTLAFTPSEELPKATTFTVTLLKDRIETVDGYQLSKSIESTISTRPLTVVEVRQVAFDDRGRYVLELSFDDKVLPADVLKHLTVKGPDGKLPVTLHGEVAGNIVRVQVDAMSLRERMKEDLNLLVELSPGLAGQSGPLAMTHPYATGMKVDSVLMATGVDAHSPMHGPIRLSVHFNNQVETQQLKDVISVEPVVPFEIVRNGSDVQLCGEFQPSSRYAVKIAAPPAGVDVHKYPRPDTLSVFVPDRVGGVWFEHGSGYLGTHGNRTVAAHAINTHDMRVTVARVYDNNLVTWQNNGHYGRGGADDFGRIVAEKKISLTREKNKQQDILLSLDELLPADDPHDGVYRIGLHTDTAYREAEYEDEEYGEYRGGDCRTAVLVTLSDIGLTAKLSHDTVTAWATSLSTAKPLADVRMRVYSDKNQLLGEGRTNAQGLATISNINPAPGERPSVVLAESGEGTDRNVRPTTRETDRNVYPTTTPSVYEPGNDLRPFVPLSSPTTQRATRGLTWLKLADVGTGLQAMADTGGVPYLRAGYEAFVYTERDVYRPGETAHLRAIVRGAHGSVPPVFPVRWQIRRPDGRDWKGQVVSLDPDGAAALDIELPSDLPTGRWTAQIGLVGESGKAGKFFGDAEFLVEEFMPDRMKVAVKIEKPQERFSLGATTKPVLVNIQGDYLFGQPAAEREATLTANLRPSSFHHEQWGAWTFGDSANTSALLDGMRALGQRIDPPSRPLDDKGHTQFELVLPVGRNDKANSPVAAQQGAQVITPDIGEVELPIPASDLITAAAPKADGAKAVYLGPWRLDVNGAVLEAGGRAVSGFDAVDVDYLQYYVGVRSVRQTTPRPGTPFAFEVSLVQPSGQITAQSKRLTATLYHDTWNNSLVFSNGRYRYNSQRVLEPCKKGCPSEVEISAGRGTISITAPTGGQYVLRLVDPDTQAVTSLQIFACDYVDGWADSVSRENPESLEIRVLPPSEVKPAPIDWPTMLSRPWNAWGAQSLQPDPFEPPSTKRERQPHQFRVGQQAQVVVRSPFAGQLLLTVETDKVLTTRVIDMPAGSVAVPIEVTEACRPNAYVTASVIRAINPNAKWRVHRAYGAAPLMVNNIDRRLKMEIAAPKEMRPENTLQVAVRVTDEGGRPVPGAALTLAAVDEGICQLTGFETPDPFDLFHRKRALGVNGSDIYSMLMPEIAKPDKNSSVGGDGGPEPSPGRHRSVVQAKRVRPVALVSAVVHADADGVARTQFAVPQFAGQLRVMAVGYAGSMYGSAEKPVLVRSPVLAQSSWPKFAAPGDMFTVPITVFNNTTAAGAAQVRIELTSGEPLDFKKTPDRTLTLAIANVKAGGQGMVSADIVAGQTIGVAHARIVTSIGSESFEESIELPVRPASPIISRGDFAATKVDTPAKLLLPADMIAGTQKIEVRCSPQPLLELPEGLDYLERYPYGCLEQTTSTCFPLVYLSDLGPKIAPGMFAKERIAQKVQVGITRLIGMQTADGGLAMWSGGHESWPWGSVYAAHFIVEAEMAGHVVPQDFRDHLLKYVHDLLNQSGDTGDLLEVQAYGAYVLALAQKPDRAVMSRLSELAKSKAMPVQPTGQYIPTMEQRAQARLFLSAAWMLSGRRDLAAGMIPQVLPQPRTNRELGGNVGSPIRDRAVLISTLLIVQPDHPQLPALVQALADAGRQHRWCSTQDVAFSVLALGRYMRQMKETKPFDTAELWNGNTKLASSTGGLPLVWEGPSLKLTADGPATVPSTGPSTQPTAQIELRIAGQQGAMGYVSWLQTGVPTKPPGDSDNGLKIRRRYLDEHGKPLNLLAVRSGQLVQVEITVEAMIPAENIVVEDLLPAGLEIENPRFVTAARSDQVESPDAKPGVRWFDQRRVDMLDDRLVIVGNSFGGGEAKYLYLARAVTSGTYNVPSIRGECMYDIGTNSISGAGAKLRISSPDRSNIAHVDPSE